MSDYITKFSLEVVAYNLLEKELAEELRKLANEFDTHQNRLDKAKLSFATTGLTGGILTITGLALAPFTFGASLGLSIAGGVIGGTSAFGNIGSLIADKVISNKSLKRAQEKLKEYAEKTDTIRLYLPELMKILNKPEKDFAQSLIENSNRLTAKQKKKLLALLQFHENVTSTTCRVSSLCRSAVSSISDVVECIITASLLLGKAGKAGKVLNGIATAANTAASTANAGRAIGTAADVGTDAAATTGKVVASSVKVVGIVAAGAGIALDLGSMIYYSRKIHKNSPTELATKIRTVAECLK